MLSPQHRMRRRTDFTETVRFGKRAGRGDIVVHLLRGGASRSPRRSVGEPVEPIVGLIVGKQVGGSVTRKRVSRKLRAAVGRVVSELPPSARLVVRALPSSAEAETAEFERQLRSAARKLADGAGQLPRNSAPKPPKAQIPGFSGEQSGSDKEGPW